MYPFISGWTLQSRLATPTSLNWKLFFSPFGHVPRLWASFLLPLILGQYTLWPTGSLFRNSTVVPACTTITCGTKVILVWHTTGFVVGAANFLSGIASTYTAVFSADLSPCTLTFPLMSPARLAPARRSTAPPTATA